MISKNDISLKRAEFFSQERPFNQNLGDFLKWLTENDSNFDTDAKTYSDTLFNNLFSAAEKNARNLPESPERRHAIRTAVAGQNKHYKAEQFLNGLEMPPTENDEIAKKWSTLVLDGTQIILDFLFDITDSGKQENYRIVFIGLFYNCVDEITAAHSLARHHYFLQANTHLRTILEILDRTELFARDSKWIDLWSSNDGKKIWNELRPKAVRKKTRHKR